ncbi:uncharacterized protein LOC111675899 [Lucilia cuprina]|uniref:uncharacterized protein LOC111675899 n=1 Tax=Lucilia cuprina TaxID=7375 RepID=UPI001F06540C|nr:uncharacterized protein LOC111675899 [Lucilia cuprina]XP_046802810.1 uncharacterized protein LOC111675899 [Lucilia cuprina]XP_046802811.1 uncharacterized protein LOC111675899 [Lucilia cuprina]
MSTFGREFEQDWPLKDFTSNLTNFGYELLQKCLSVEKPRDKQTDILQFLKKSEEFPVKFPVDSCRVKSQKIERLPFIIRQIESAYPVVHEKVVYLIIDFLEHKLKYGSSKEKLLYANMSITDFVHRLLSKRCVTFVDAIDEYLLITGETGQGDDYLKIGTEEEEDPLVLNKVLSYDEVKISALLSITSHSEFINEGQRENAGRPETDLNKIEREGVVVGLVGARFAREERMEYEDIQITQLQNIEENGYGSRTIKKSYNQEKARDYRRVWNKFYEEQDHLYEEVSIDNKRFGKCFEYEAIFDNLVMKKRFSIAFDLLLLEANARALRAHKQAYIHVVGIGLGVWLAAPQQEKIFMECFQQRLKYLLPQLNNVGVVHLSWFRLNEWHDFKNGGFLKSKTHPMGGVTTLISSRNPNEKLTGPYENMLPVVSFAWDGNALPGNEFWIGSITSSNDPSAACSTLISELFNPHINTTYVNGNNLYIASPKYGLIHIKDYAEKVLN